jgi:serine/threonine protein kinase
LKHQKIKDDFDIVKGLGQGQYGEVKLARNKKTGVLEVIKKINVAPMDTKNEEMTKNEIEMLI